MLPPNAPPPGCLQQPLPVNPVRRAGRCLSLLPEHPWRKRCVDGEGTSLAKQVGGVCTPVLVGQYLSRRPRHCGYASSDLR